MTTNQRRTTISTDPTTRTIPTALTRPTVPTRPTNRAPAADSETNAWTRRRFLQGAASVGAGLALPLVLTGRAHAAKPLKKTFNAKIIGDNFASIGSPTGIYEVQQLAGGVLTATLDVTTIVKTAPNFLHDTYKTVFKYEADRYTPVAEWKTVHHKIDGKDRGVVNTRVLFAPENYTATLQKTDGLALKTIRYSPGDLTPFLLLARMIFGDLRAGVYPCVINFEPVSLFRGIVKVKETRYGIEALAPLRAKASLDNSDETVRLLSELDEGKLHVELAIPGSPEVHLYENG